MNPSIYKFLPVHVQVTNVNMFHIYLLECLIITREGEIF